MGKTSFIKAIFKYRFITLTVAYLYAAGNVFAQNTPQSQFASVISTKSYTGIQNFSFIKNIGQYGKKLTGFEALGNIQYGFEGQDMPVLFTDRGVVHLQRKIEKISKQEEEELEKKGVPEDVIERKRTVTDRVIAMEWVGISPDVIITTEEKTSAYHTYGMLPDKAPGYKKIIYKNAYPGIDVVYSFTANEKPGFEYSLIVQPGADISLVKLKYNGDVTSITKNSKGDLIIHSDIDGISISAPVSYYGSKISTTNTGEFKTGFQVLNNQINFSFPDGYDKTRAIVIDPFVAGTGNLTGVNAGKAKDVDFDYAGNVYVTGGGDGGLHKLAKFNAAGVLQWTFNGTLTVPSWSYGPYYGGFVVDKNTGGTYLGQGFAPATGYRVVRISTTGLYDNYISTGNINFNENWKMYWNCNGGTPQIMVIGGGTSFNNNLGIITPPATTVTAINLTGISTVCQDMVDMAFDPANNDIYTLFASLFVTPVINNKIYKNTAPYGPVSAWNVPSGFTVVREAGNRPYLAQNLPTYDDNAANVLSVNASYLYYWDGKNLKAFNKANGTLVGTALITANTPLMQGGIIADACNNIFVGEGNGVIKVYNFDGSTFSDAPADIPIPGFAGKAVYDLAYDPGKKLIYASGDGFVGSFDVSAYCATTPYTVNVTTNCVTKTATATVSPTPPLGSTVTYSLYIGTTLITTNTTGVFTGLSPGITYTVVATINQACSGTQATTTFILPGPTIAVTSTNTVCGASTGTITATASGSTAPYTYSIDGTNFQASGTFTGLAAGVYTVTAKDANGCTNTTTVIITNTNGPSLTYTQTNATCGNNAGTVTANATGGTAPYQYSINGGTTYQTGNFFTGLTAGNYTLVVKDANNCTNSAIVTITTSPGVNLTAVPAASTCNQSNGTITAFGSDGTPPLEYSINGNTFQASNIFTGLAAGAYTVYVRDAAGCIKTTNVTVASSPGPAVTATSTPAACGNINGTITATGSNGISPYQYSINGVTFQISNVFTGLASGTYTVTIKDNTGCTNFTTVIVASTNGPTVTAVTTASTCNAPSGTITATGSGGTPGYQYSINGTVFQVSNLFTGLAPGNYIVYVRDANLCIGTVTVTVTAVAGPTLTVVTTASSCNVNDGTITANAAGGATPYEYSLDGVTYQVSNVFTGLAPGNYTVYVRDANLCVKTAPAVIANASGLTLSVSTVSASCGNNGVITATATGNAPPLQYSINGTTYQASNVFTGLAPGTYTVYVKDANNCIISKQAVVGNAAVLSVTANAVLPATCTQANGVIVANGTGGVAPLTYSINGTIYQSSNTFINVAAGTYTVYVKDATGCIATTSVTVINGGGTGPGISTFTVVVTDALLCAGDLGKITNPKVNGSNCTTCTYSLNFGAYVPYTTQLFLNLTPGTYYVTAKDVNGCTKTIIAVVGSAATATATATSTGSACNASTGTITLTGIGINTPFHSSINGIGGPWATWDPTTTYTGLAPGTYTIIIADDGDFKPGPPVDPGACLDTIVVNVPSIGGPSVSTTQVNSTCNASNGSITATGSGGAGGPYTYNINGGAFFASGVFNNLPADTYIVSVKDAAGCITGTTVIISTTAQPSLTVLVLPATCNTSNGVITATASGGTAPYTYSINGTTFQSSNVFTNLAPGTYTVYVKDANNCFRTVSAVISTVPNVQVSAYSVAANCGASDGSIVATGSSGTPPYTYSINGTVFQSSNTFTGLAAGFYTVTVKDARDCINTTGISVNNSGAAAITATTTSSTCGNSNGSITVTATGGTSPLSYSIDGINFQASNIFSGLAAGNYTITVKDANDCISTRQVLVANINGPQTLNAAVVHATCGNSNGSITASATGGTAPLQYSINGTVYQVSALFSGLAAGTYTVYVKDVNNCIKTLPGVVINDLPGPTATAVATAASCGLNDGTITITATGGTVPLSYSINNGTTYQASNIFTGLPAGSYIVRVRDAKNCISAPVNIVVTTVNPVTPTFTQAAPICSGGTLNPLPTTSNNGITGSWAPALNNSTTTTYTFTPTPGQCATTTTMTIVVNPLPTPVVTGTNPACVGTTQTYSTPAVAGNTYNWTVTGGTIASGQGTNTITVTWNTAGSNNVTVTETITSTGCTANNTLVVTVNPKPAPNIIYHN